MVDIFLEGKTINFYSQKIYFRKSSFRHAIVELIDAKAIAEDKEKRYPFRKNYSLTTNGAEFVRGGLKK